MKKRIIAALMALLLVCSLTVTAHEVPDLTKTGTITFNMDWNGESLTGGSLTMHRVGDIVENDGNYSFACVAEINAVSLEDLNDPALAANLAAAAKAADLEAITTPISGGEAVFYDVACGLYVVTQDEQDSTEGFAPLSPFLISMPQFENGRYVTEVNADPKVTLETAPTEPTEPVPTQPNDPKLPQTGQLNWPVPILAASGLALFVAGWFLRFGRKKIYEK